MDTESPCHIIAVRRKIHDLRVLIQMPDCLPRLNAIHPFHIYIKKNSLIAFIILHKLLSGRKTYHFNGGVPFLNDIFYF